MFGDEIMKNEHDFFLFIERELSLVASDQIFGNPKGNKEEISDMAEAYYHKFLKEYNQNGKEFYESLGQRGRTKLQVWYNKEKENKHERQK